MRKAEMEEPKEGVKITGRTLTNLRYADDRKKVDLTKLKKKVEERKRKGGAIFQHK